MTTKCIYCNTKEKLSESDIIPDALTNAKLTKKNVCTIAHNNRFSDLFESEVINNLAFLRDKLDIQTKSHKYPETEVNFKIGETQFKKKGNKNSNLVGDNIISNGEKNLKLGPIDQIKKIVDSKEKKGEKTSDIKVLDINNEIIETQIPLNLEVFFSPQSKRLMAKMAYEFYCYHNQIEGFHEEFSKIVDFICEGRIENKELVTYVQDINIYRMINDHTINGSHTLITYVKPDGTVNVLVSFFGICIYNVEILEKATSKFKFYCLLQEFKVNSKKVTLKKESISHLEKFINENTITQTNPLGITVQVAKDMNNSQIWEGVGLYVMFAKKIGTISSLPKFDSELIQLVKQQYLKILNETVIHIRSLKRFVKERFPNETNIINLNPKGTESESISMFYIIFLLGKSTKLNVTIEDVNQLIQQAFSTDNEIRITKELILEMLSEMISTENYSSILDNGARKIKDSIYD